MDPGIDRSNPSWQDSFSGSVLVKQAGATLVDSSYGLANREEGRPNTPKTAFQIASISKQFTAAAILLLQEQGALSVHDRIHAWVPHCPAEWAPITIHQLLTHTSGIGHWDDFPRLSLYEPNTRDNLIAIFQGSPLKLKPGSEWAYSSPGYVLLAHIVEQVSGQPYASFLCTHIFQPLGMDRTGAGNSAPHSGQQALGYAGSEPAPSFDLDTVGVGAGDIWSTTADMARWDSTLMAPALLSESSLKMMFGLHVPVPPTRPGTTTLHYAYGWFIAESKGHALIFHTGGNAGFVSINAWLPADDAVIVVLSNDEECNPREVGMYLARDVLGIDVLEP